LTVVESDTRPSHHINIAVRSSIDTSAPKQSSMNSNLSGLAPTSINPDINTPTTNGDDFGGMDNSLGAFASLNDGSTNKRRRPTDEQPKAFSPAINNPRVPMLRLSTDLATKLGIQYCTDNELVSLMLSHNMCSRASTFLVKATLMGDLNEWISITLDDEHASVADVKRAVELSKGIRPATQELFLYDETWTGTLGSGGSGHSVAQEDAALLEEGFTIEGPCSLLVSVNASYALVMEGRKLGMKDVYERVAGKMVNERGVWQALGGMGRFLYYCSSAEKWVFSEKNAMEAGAEAVGAFVCSTAATPDQITERWRVGSRMAWIDAPKLRVRVCSSIEKHAADWRLAQEQERALAQAQLAQRLVAEGLTNDGHSLMGVYQLLEGKVVSGKGVWQKLGSGGERFLYFGSTNQWIFSTQEHMEVGAAYGWMRLTTTALTADQAHPSEMWRVHNGREFVVAPEVRVRLC
jgi:hypothetical protein